MVEHLVQVAALRRRPPPRARGVAPVGDAPPAQRLGQPVVGQAHGGGGVGHLGVDRAEPRPRGHRERRHRHAPRRRRPPLGPEVVDEGGRLGRRAGVVPEHGRAQRGRRPPRGRRGRAAGRRRRRRPPRRPGRSRPARDRRAAAHSAGSVSEAVPPRRRRPVAVCTRWGARPEATTAPESTSTTTTLVAEVEQSTPATSCATALVSRAVTPRRSRPPPGAPLRLRAVDRGPPRPRPVRRGGAPAPRPGRDGAAPGRPRRLGRQLPRRRPRPPRGPAVRAGGGGGTKGQLKGHPWRKAQWKWLGRASSASTPATSTAYGRFWRTTPGRRSSPRSDASTVRRPRSTRDGDGGRRSRMGAARSMAHTRTEAPSRSSSPGRAPRAVPCGHPTVRSSLASNRRGTVKACQVIEVEGGKIRSTRHYFDLMTLLQDIGVMERSGQPRRRRSHASPLRGRIPAAPRATHRTRRAQPSEASMTGCAASGTACRSPPPYM